jgi:hypothetical protein
MSASRAKRSRRDARPGLTEGNAVELDFRPVQSRNAAGSRALTPEWTYRSIATMTTTTTYTQERRSSRVFMRLRVIVAGKNRNKRRFREVCETIVISAHGGLLYLSQEVEKDTLLVVSNPFTQEEQECRVAYLGDDSGKGQRVGLEFLTPAPHFWGVEFAQPDWPAPAARPVSLRGN